MTTPPIDGAYEQHTAPEPQHVSIDDAPPALPRASRAFIAAYWFAQLGNWLSLLTPVTIGIALRVAELASPADKAAQLALVVSVGAFGSLIAAPLWGQISDRTRSRIGRRKLWMLVGVFGGGVGLFIMAAAPNMLVFGAGWLVAQVAFNANQASLNALLPDQIPGPQRGRVSGLLGLSATVAVLIATFLSQFTSVNPYLLFLTPWAVTVVSLFVVLRSFQDRPARPGAFPAFGLKEFAKSFWVNPLVHKDYGWAWLSRFFVFLGASFVQVYSVYLLQDRFEIGPAEVTTLVFVNTVIGSSMTLLFSPLSGWISDRTGRRKPFVLVAALIAAAGLVLIGFADTLPLFFIASAIASAGIAVYYAVDLALVANVLPDPENSAKDMGVFQIANSLPQSLGPAIAPMFLAIGAVQGGNYAALFIAAAVFAIIGAVAIAPVRGSR